MERLAFGPSLLNAAKLLALIRAGRVDVTGLRASPGAGGYEIDAVCPGPEVLGTPLDRLVRGGHARVADGRRGVVVEDDGTVAPGLAVIGRPTEDWVIGNDTLDRTLHHHTDRWARRVGTRARSMQVYA
jgi:diaminopimelate decarboxylase